MGRRLKEKAKEKETEKKHQKEQHSKKNKCHMGGGGRHEGREFMLY